MQATREQTVVDFFAQGYRTSGTLGITNRTLADMIYDETVGYLYVRHAYLSPITEPAKIVIHYATVTLSKHNLDFALTTNEKEGLRRDQRYSLGNFTYNLSLTVPFFEIEGRLYSALRTFDPRIYLAQEASDFITLLDVTARCTFNPDISYHGEAALIARAKIGFLGEKRRDK